MNNCYFCNKKIKSIFGFECICKNTFCMKHMHRHAHNCSNMCINKSIIKKKLSEDNPKIINDKINKI